MIAPRVPLEIEIHPGEHPTGHLLGMTFNLDTIWTTVVAGGDRRRVSGFLARGALTKDTEDHVPTKLQLVWETVVNQVNTQVEDNLGQGQPVRRAAGGLAVLLHPDRQLARAASRPSSTRHVHLLPSPTADTNLTYAMALIVMCQRVGLRHPPEGLRGLLQALPRAVPRSCSR